MSEDKELINDQDKLKTEFFELLDDPNLTEMLKRMKDLENINRINDLVEEDNT